MKKNFKMGLVAATLLAVAPVFASVDIVKADSTPAAEVTSAAEQNQGTVKNVTMKHGGFIFDKNGDFAINNQRYIFFKKGRVLGAWNSGKIVKINGQKYYQVGDNQYVKVSCIKNKKHKKGIKKHLKKNKKAVKKTNKKKINKKHAKKLVKKMAVVD